MRGISRHCDSIEFFLDKLSVSCDNKAIINKGFSRFKNSFLASSNVYGKLPTLMKNDVRFPLSRVRKPWCSKTMGLLYGLITQRTFLGRFSRKFCVLWLRLHEVKVLLPVETGQVLFDGAGLTTLKLNGLLLPSERRICCFRFQVMELFEPSYHLNLHCALELAEFIIAHFKS